MGYSDRDYYREDTTGDSMGIPGQSMVVRLIVINVVVFLADWITASGGKHWLFEKLAVHGDTVVNPIYWYQFLTAGFVHNNEHGLWHIMGNMFALYVFGKPLEDRLGGKEMLRLYLFAIVLGNLVWGLRQYFTVLVAGPVADTTLATTFGASAGVTTLTLLFCLYYPRATINLFFVIPTPAWIVGILIVIGDLSGVRSQYPKAPWYQVGLDNYAVGCLFTLAYWYFGWNFGRLPGLRGLANMWTSLTKLLSPRPNIRVHEPERDYEDLEEEADRLLAKVGQQGESSLTAKERKVLEEYSRWMRQKHR